MLNKASADIMKWCDENMVKYNKELKESNYGYIGREQNFYIQPSRMYFIQIR